jgi:hypothetical protein
MLAGWRHMQQGAGDCDSPWGAPAAWRAAVMKVCFRLCREPPAEVQSLTE